MSRSTLPFDVRRYQISSYLPLEDIDSEAVLQQEIRRRPFDEAVDFIVDQDNPEYLQWMLEARHYPEEDIEIIADKAIYQRKPNIISWLYENDFDILKFYNNMRNKLRRKDIRLLQQYPSVYELIMLDPEKILPIFIDDLDRITIWHRGYIAQEEGFDNIIQMYDDIANLTGFITDDIVGLTWGIVHDCISRRAYDALEAYLTSRKGRYALSRSLLEPRSEQDTDPLSCIAKDDTKRTQMLKIIDILNKYPIRKSKTVPETQRDIWRRFLQDVSL